MPVREIRAYVQGVPVPQGSMRAFKGGDGAAYMTHANPKLKEWRGKVRNSLSAFPAAYFTGAVYAHFVFALPRPRKCPRAAPCVRPDLDKLVRSILDAATDAGVWLDDGQVTQLFALKQYVREGEEPYVRIYLKGLGV